MATTELRTAAANRARMRASEEKAAERLRDRGWICLAPGSDDYEIVTGFFPPTAVVPEQES
jgi:hypothetical protein